MADAPLREEPQEPARSAEREALAQACSTYAAAADRLKTLQAALDRSRRDKWMSLTAVEAAERVLETARKEAPRRTAAGAIGEEFKGSAPTVEVAERDYERACGGHRHLAGVLEVLEQEIASQEADVATARARRQRAICAVLDTDPALNLTYAEYCAALAWSAALADVFRLIGPVRLPRRFQHFSHWDGGMNHPLPLVQQPLPEARWREALAKLEAGEVDTVLPAFG